MISPPGRFLFNVDLNEQIINKQRNVCGIVDWEDAATSPLEIYDIYLRWICRLWWQDWKESEWLRIVYSNPSRSLKIILMHSQSCQ